MQSLGSFYASRMSEAAAGGSSRGPYANTPRRKAEIVAAAAAIFSQSGYHGGSLRQIARDLDLSFTSVKHHFPSKEVLLIEVLKANDEINIERLREDRLNMGFVESTLAMAQRNLENPEALRLFAVLSAEATSVNHPAHDWFDDRYRRIIASMGRGIAADVASGTLAPVDQPDVAAAALVSLWDGLQLQWLMNPTFDMIAPMRIAFPAVLQAFATNAPDLAVHPYARADKSTSGN